ncbi:MAG: hypothetical protein KAS66_03975 [Candidatus Omnitrophica bacterium]|nr:hypothetical protein [Candidatus Omnitrophota bacterium]
MDRELRPGEVTWKTFKEQMCAKGVDDDTVVKSLHLRTQEPIGLTAFALGMPEEKDRNFEFVKSDEIELIELKSRIRYLTEDLEKLRKESEEDKYNIRVLRGQIQTLTDLLCGCQDKLLKAVLPNGVEIPEERESVKITVKKHPRCFLQDMKRTIIDKGFKYAGIKHVDNDTVEISFEKKE